MNKKFIPIVLSYTTSYFTPAATCIYSILKNSSKNYRFHFISLSNVEIPTSYIEKLELIDPERTIFSCINLSDKLAGVYVDERYTIAASYRLLLASILTNYDKVIYVDCDMIIRADLGDLYTEIRIEDYYLGGVAESTLDFQEEYIRKLGCLPGKYINSGFLVMNLKKMREDYIEAKFINALKTDYLEFPDQDVINMICKERILYLSPVYNSIRTFFIDAYDYSFKKYYNNFDKRILRDYGNIHYTGGKPWNIYTIEFNVWWTYYCELRSMIDIGPIINIRLYLMFKMLNIKMINSFIVTLKNQIKK